MSPASGTQPAPKPAGEIPPAGPAVCEVASVRSPVSVEEGAVADVLARFGLRVFVRLPLSGVATQERALGWVTG